MSASTRDFSIESWPAMTKPAEPMNPWKTPPNDLTERVRCYVERATSPKIDRKQLARFAHILVAAEEVVKYRTADEQVQRDRMAIIAASDHGVEADDPRDARRGYNEARKAQQEAHNCAKGCARRLDRLLTLLQTRHNRLRSEARTRFPIKDIEAARALILSFVEATKPTPTLANIKIARSELSLTVAGHAVIWWRQSTPVYSGKWKHMHFLARRWLLTDIRDLEDFRRWVQKLNRVRVRGVSAILRCPGWATK